LVREFIESDTETSRFTVMSELVGAGRINDFRRELERERNAWSRARTRREDELQAALARLEQVRARLERLREAGSPAGILSEWAAWWEQARTRGVTDAAPEATSVKAPSVLGDALGSLQTLRRRLERRREEVADLLREWSQRSAKETETLPTIVETSQRRRDELAAEHAALQSALLQTQTEAAHERERLIQTQETEAEMRSLAALAIRHLGETCPVCAQKHDVDRTRRRLEDLLHSQPTHDPTPIFERVAALNQQIVDTEKALAAATAEVATRERATADERIWARTNA